MDPVSLLPAVMAVVVALLTASVIARLHGAPTAEGRFATVDGLRGFLAFFVFLHHGCLWYFYLRSGSWDLPPSHLYTHFGQSSVALFFMITGFLFFSKLLDGRQRGIDWIRLYVSRVLRLVPLYLVVMLAMGGVVLVLSGFRLRQPLPALADSLLHWLSFTALGFADINGVKDTFIIVAGVTWSLAYEWLFYLVLPVLALTVGLFPPALLLVTGLATVLVLVLHPSLHYLSFVGGIAGAVVARNAPACRLLQRPAVSVLALALLVVTVAGFPVAYSVLPLLLLSLFFVLIAAGNSLFGLLLSQSARTLGEYAYGIYLVHGLLLFVTFRFVLGFERARGMTPTAHWLLIIALTPVLTLLCFLLFRYVEQPAMQKTAAVSGWLHRRLPDRLLRSLGRGAQRSGG